MTTVRITRAAWIAATVLVAGLAASAARVERLAGDSARPALVFEVGVPRDALAEMPAALVEATWRGRLRDFTVRTAPIATPPDASAVGVRVTVVGAEQRHAVEVTSAITSSARFEIRPVADGTPRMADWYQAVQNGSVAGVPADVIAEPDAWRDERTGTEHYDSYLASPRAVSIDTAVTALQKVYPLPAGMSVEYEFVELPPDYPADYAGPSRTLGRSYYRTYLVADDVILDNEHVAEADVIYDPNTNRPEVLVTLTRDGARRFGDATTELVGAKIAIIVNGRVMSAPVVQSPILGGRTTITMGGTDPRQQLEDAQALAGALGARSILPPGIDARQVGARGRSDALVLAMRALAALLAGAVAAALALLSDRRRWFAAAVDVSPGRERWDALAVPALVTFIVPLLLWYASTEVEMPGVNPVEMGNVFAAASRGARAQIGVFALGIMPVVSAFLLVELYAILVEFLVPARRGRRLGTPADRRRLDRAAWILTAGLAVMQAYFMAQYLEGMSMRGVEVLIDDKAKWLVTVSLATGVMIQIVVAEQISRYGLANGFLVLFAAGSAIDLVDVAEPFTRWGRMPDTPSTLLLVAIAAVAAFATVVSTRTRAAPDGPRLPYTGIVPASIVRGSLGLLALVALWSTWAAEQLHRAQEYTVVAELGATVPMTALILWSTKRAWTTPGVAATMAFLAAIVALPFVVAEPYRLAVPVADGVLIGAVAAEIAIGALARVRIPDARTVLVVHDVFRADDAADRLRAAGIPCALVGVRARAVLRFTAAFAPIAVRVPAARADEASALLAPPPS